MKFITRLDRYVIKQFLGTFFFSIVLILSIAIIFDVAEKLDKFLNPDLPLKEIIINYYFNFVPYYANLFAPLFIFISVIYFTTRLANNSEVIAMLASGMSFKRLLRPYMVAASLLALLTVGVNSFILPPANKIRIDFQNKWIKDKRKVYAERIQMQTSPGEFAFFSSYSQPSKTGYEFSLTKFDGKDLVQRITASSVTYDTLYNWTLNDYVITKFGARQDTIIEGSQLDTIINVKPSEFLLDVGSTETMTTPDIIHYIELQKRRGAPSTFYEIELHKRMASVMAAFILTAIGVALSAKKRKGGMGLTMAIGLSLSFTYIFFMTVASSFAVAGEMSPFVAAWLPNFCYLPIAIGLMRFAPK